MRSRILKLIYAEYCRAPRLNDFSRAGLCSRVDIKFLKNKDILWLLERVISSFSSIVDSLRRSSGRIDNWDIGLPLGNLTSQLFVNIFMNEFDQFVKHKLKVKFYIRYADDFVVFSEDKEYLESLKLIFGNYLKNNLKLDLHPNKVFIKTLASGVDFLGWVNFFDHRVVRAGTRKRMFRNIARSGGKKEVVQSYLGLLGHGNGYNLSSKIRINF